MIVLVSGASHTGKTALAQKLLEKYKYPYLSIDLIKMGLIRSDSTKLTPEDDTELEMYLWPIVREIIKTAVENRQNLVVEGCYIPFDWKKDFDSAYLTQIRHYCLVMTEDYIDEHFDKIKEFANIIEHRLDDSYLSMEAIKQANAHNLQMCKKHDCSYILIDDCYNVDIEL